jgi:DNA topoisomerase-1
MRTDSVNLSQTAQKCYPCPNSKKILEKNMFSHVNTASKVANAQEAHEAIRPSYPEKETIDDGDRDMQRVYELIWKRAVASQMADAKLERTTVNIAVSAHPKEYLVAKGE